MKGKIALIAGATGLVGRELVHLLIHSDLYEKVKVIVRRPMGITHPKLEEHILQLEDLDDYEIGPADHVYCCLGTTIKKAGTKENFRKVDLEFPLKLARKANEISATQFLVISALGANPSSAVFYSQTKGELERGLKGEDLHALHIFRPSLLIGERKEFRLGEEAAAIISRFFPFIFKGALKKYRPIKAGDVALAMAKIAQAETSGYHLYLSPLIQKVADGKGRP